MSSTMSNSKAMEALGVSIPDLIKLTIENRVLDTSAYNYFWSVLHGASNRKHQNNVTQFIISIMEKLQAVLKQKKVDEREAQLLINTLAFCALTLPIKVGIPLVDEAVKALQAVHSQDRRFPAVEEVCRLVLKVIDPKGCDINWLVRNTCNLLSSEELQERDNILKCGALNGKNPIGGEGVKIYSYLMDMVLSFDDQVKLLENLGILLNSINSNLKTISKTFKISPQLSTVQLMALLHLTQSVLPYCGQISVDTLKKLHTTLDEFITWARPSSDAAEYTREAIGNEISSRGQSLVDTFLTEARLPQLEFKLLGETTWAQPLFHFMDSASLQSSCMFRLIKMRNMSSWTADEEMKSEDGGLARGLDPVCQSQILFQLFMIHLDCDAGELAGLIGRIDPEQLPDLFYDSCLASFEGTNTGTNTEDDQGSLQKRYKELYVSMASKSIPTVDVSEDTLTSIQTMCELPEIMHVAILEELGSRWSSDIAKSIERKLEKIITRHLGVADVADPAIIRLMISGSDRLLHSVVMALSSLQAMKPDIFVGIQLQWYVVPVEDNMLASFIARHDAWYNRHVYTPLRLQTPILPWMQANTLSWVAEDNSFPVGPGILMREVLESYGRQACHQVEIAIQEIQCWSDIGSPTSAVIPFMMRLEISSMATAKCMKAILGDPRSIDEILRDKNFESPAVYSQYLKTTLTGVATRVVAREDPMDTLICANLPIYGDTCYPADPSEKGLELFGHYIDSQKKLPSEQKCTIMALEITAVSKNPEDMFYMLIDGAPYGPFWRVLFAVEELDRDLVETKVESMVFQTFFPFAV